MPRPNPELEFEDDDVEFDDFRIRRPPLAWTTTASVSSVLAWGALAAHNIVTMPTLDGVPNVSFDRITGCARFAPRYVSNDSNDSRRRVASPRAVGRANDVIECATFMISLVLSAGTKRNETDRLTLTSLARASLSLADRSCLRYAWERFYSDYSSSGITWCTRRARNAPTGWRT